MMIRSARTASIAALALWLLAGIALAAPLDGARAQDSRLIATPRGAPISVIAHAPDGPGPFPAVILAPGTGTLRQKINEVVAAALEKRGFAVYRFEWAYYVKDKKGSPSDTDRAPEIEDLKTVLALARADKRIDSANILVGGKSRGTIISWLVFREDPALKGILQLTPVCTKTGFTPAGLYPDADKETRSSLWISGDADPACEVRALHTFMATVSGKARSHSLRGDHGLSGDSTSALAAALAVDFAEEAVGRTIQ